MCTQIRPERGHLDNFEVAVWAEVAAELEGYEAAGATWWIETAKPGTGWQDGLRSRIAAELRSANG